MLREIIRDGLRSTNGDVTATLANVGAWLNAATPEDIQAVLEETRDLVESSAPVSDSVAAEAFERFGENEQAAERMLQERVDRRENPELVAKILAEARDHLARALARIATEELARYQSEQK